MSTSAQSSSTAELRLLLASQAGTGRYRVASDMIDRVTGKSTSRKGREAILGTRWIDWDAGRPTLRSILEDAMKAVGSDKVTSNVATNYESVIEAWNTAMQEGFTLSERGIKRHFAGQDNKISEKVFAHRNAWRGLVFSTLHNELYRVLDYITNDSDTAIMKEMHTANADFPDAVSSLHPGIYVLVVASLWSRAIQRSDLLISSFPGLEAVFDHLGMLWSSGHNTSRTEDQIPICMWWEENKAQYLQTATDKIPNTAEGFHAAFYQHPQDTKNVANLNNIRRAHRLRQMFTDEDFNKAYETLCGLADEEIEDEVKDALSLKSTDEELMSTILDWHAFSISQSSASPVKDKGKGKKGAKGRKGKGKRSARDTDGTAPSQSSITPSAPSTYTVYVNINDGYRSELLNANLGEFRSLIGQEGQIPSQETADMAPRLMRSERALKRFRG